MRWLLGFAVVLLVSLFLLLPPGPVQAQTEPVPTPRYEGVSGKPGSLDEYYAYVCTASSCCTSASCGLGVPVCHAVLAAESQSGFGELTAPLPSGQMGTFKSCLASVSFLPPAYYKQWSLMCGPEATCTGAGCAGYNNYSGQTVLPDQGAYPVDHWQLINGVVNWDTDNTVNGGYALTVNGPATGVVGGGYTATQMIGAGYVIQVSAAAQNSLSSKVSTFGGSCHFMWERHLPLAVPTVQPTITPTLWVVTPTITPMITPVPSVTGWPCVGIACPPGSTPWPTSPPWGSTPWPTPTGLPSGEIGIGDPVSVGCFTMIPRFHWEAPSYVLWMLRRDAFGLDIKEFRVCANEVDFKLNMFGIDIAAWVMGLLFVAGVGVIYGVLRRG